MNSTTSQISDLLLIQRNIESTEMYDKDIVIVVEVDADERDKAWVSITSRNDLNLRIIIEDGEWYQL